MSSPIVDDYYALLGVDAGADDAALRMAWRQLAAAWHPDRAGVGATAKFQQLSAAYTVLCDPVARAAYDRRRVGASGMRGGDRRTTGDAANGTANANSPAAAATTSSPSRPVRASAPAVMLSRLTGHLNSLLARGAARLDDPGVVTLVLNETEAAQGGMARVTLRVDLWCADCAAKERPAGCVRCGGSRKVEELFSAWLAVPPGVAAGEMLTPSAELPGMVEAVRFRVAMRDRMGKR